LKDKTTRKAWMVVALLFVVAMLNYLDRTMIVTMRESLVSQIRMTDAQFGLLTAVFLWIYGLLSPFAGFVADRFKKSHVIIGSLFVWSLVTWMTANAQTFEQLLLTRALMGVSEAFYIPAALSLIIDYHRGPTQSLATGLHISGTMVGSSMGAIGGWIAEKYLWNNAFTIFGIIGIVYSVFLFFTLKEAPTKLSSTPQQHEVKRNIRFTDALKALFSRPSFSYLLLFWCMASIVSWMVVSWLPTYYKEHFNLSQSLAGLYATTFLYPASIVGLIVAGFVSDRWNRKSPYSRVFVPAIGLSIAAPCVFMGSYTAVLGMAVVFFLIYGLTRMTVDSNLMPVLNTLVDGRYRATGYGILNMLATTVSGIGIYAAGAMRDANIRMELIFRYASFFILICVFLLLLVKIDMKKTLKKHGHET